MVDVDWIWFTAYPGSKDTLQKSYRTFYDVLNSNNIMKLLSLHPSSSRDSTNILFPGGFHAPERFPSESRISQTAALQAYRLVSSSVLSQTNKLLDDQEQLCATSHDFNIFNEGKLACSLGRGNLLF